MKVLCIIVLYNQKLYDSLSYQTGISKFLNNNDISLFIYDNSQIPQHIKQDFDQFEGRIVYNSDSSNPGVSYAYNKGYEYAKANGFQWISLWDQDTTIDGESYLSACFEALSSNPQVKLFVPLVKTKKGITISPVREIFRIPICGYSDSLTEGLNKLSKIGIINSGIFVEVKAFGEVNGYNEKVFLDFSDYQFIERFSKKYKLFFLLNTICIQDFSNEENDVYKLSVRYSLFCRSLRNYEMTNFFDRLNILLIVLKRAVALSFRTKRLLYLKIFLNEFVGI